MTVQGCFGRLFTLSMLGGPALVLAATPASGTLTPTSGPLSYSAGAFTIANPTLRGLGLSISHGIAAAHGGSLELCDSGQRGACFRLTLPAHAEGLKSVRRPTAVA